MKKQWIDDFKFSIGYHLTDHAGIQAIISNKRFTIHKTSNEYNRVANATYFFSNINHAFKWHHSGEYGFHRDIGAIRPYYLLTVNIEGLKLVDDEEYSEMSYFEEDTFPTFCVQNQLIESTRIKSIISNKTLINNRWKPVKISDI
jgi:hypothetical protein